MPETGAYRWSHPAVILVATDLTDLDRLMPFALEQAAQTGARLILLHVVASTSTMSVDAVGMPYYDSASILEFAEKAMLPRCEAAQRRSIPCDALVREGQATQQIAAASRQFQADRLLLGTRSRGKLGKLLLGSVAEQVLRSVNIPVITVGPEAHLPVESAGQQRLVLHATSLRETSQSSAALACQVAACQGARLLLLHVLPPLSEPPADGTGRSGQPASLDSAAMQELYALAAETGAAAGLSVEPLVVHGNPAIEILAAASERHANLIVLGATQRSAFENLTRDRTVYRVLAHARCPVLTLREALAASDAVQPENVAAFHS
jgi:nucleotide-binding universal stress UspA family protein